MHEREFLTLDALGTALIVLGAACVLIVIVPDAAAILGWRHHNSVGRYFDVVSAVLGGILIPLGFAIRYLRPS